MKFWIYVICFLPSLIADVLIKEYVSFSSIASSLIPNSSINERAWLSGLISAFVWVLLYTPPFYVSKKLIEYREGKEESRAEKIITKITKIIGITLGSLVMASALILILQIDSVWFETFIRAFCDVLVVVGFIVAVISVFISPKHKMVKSVFRLSGYSLVGIGLVIFYLFAKLHNM